MFTPNPNPNDYTTGNAVKIIITNANKTFDYMTAFATSHIKNNNTLEMIFEKDDMGEYCGVIERIHHERDNSPTSKVEIIYGTETDTLTNIADAIVNNYRNVIAECLA